MFASVSVGGSSPRGTVTIIRDNYGVPHVFADTLEGLSFGVGYAVAEDRLWQADLFRRQATGRLAEFFLEIGGVDAVLVDYYIRLETYSLEERTELFNEIASPYKEMITAYTEGINLYIAEAYADVYNKMPVEYLAQGLLPEPWTVEDSLAIGQMMVKEFGEAGGSELKYAEALLTLQAMHEPAEGWDIFNDLYPQVDPGADTTLNWGDDDGSSGSSSLPSFPTSIAEAAKKDKEMRELIQQISASLGMFYKFGSNAWVVGPKKSATRNALLLGGPQMGHSIPQIVLDVGMHGAGIDAVGMTFPGVGPAILIGVSKWGAWTTTSGLSDEVDTYIEVLNPANPTQYLFNGEWCNMEMRIETIYNASDVPHYFPVYRTVHGPVFYSDGVNAYTKRRAFWKAERGTLEGFFSFQGAKSMEEFEEGVRKIVSSHNMFWADRRANIAYWHAGAYPIRPQDIDDRFPLWGTGEEEWLGIIPFEELPQGKNPEEGFYANWNNKPSPEWEGKEVDWGEGHIVVRIQELLDADPKISFQDMIDICRNVAYHYVYGTYFKGFLVDSAEKEPSISKKVVKALKNWNNYLNDENLDGYYDDPGLTIFSAWYDAIFDPIFADDLGPIGASHSLLLHVFDGPESKLPLNHNYLNGVDKDVIIVEVLKEVLKDLKQIYGPHVSEWLTPVEMVDFDELGALPSIPMHYMNRGTYNQIAELSRKKWWDPSHAVNVIPPGQSGFMQYPGIPSSHAYDQLILYETWQFKLMLFHIEDLLEVAESITPLG